MQVKRVRRSALLLWLVLCSVVAAAHAAAYITNRLEYDGHSHVYGIRHGRQLGIAQHQHSVSMLTQFHKEGKAGGRCWRARLGGPKRMRRRKRTDSLMERTGRQFRSSATRPWKKPERLGDCLPRPFICWRRKEAICIAHTNVRVISSRTTASAVGGLLALPCLRQRMVWRRGCRSTGEEESSHSCVTVFKRVVPSLEAAAEEEGATIKAVHGAVASFDGTGRET
ncbi:hypothetical protein ERJ75_001697600 [Trypanosoma vivax]|nr:hypothetical protein ERJ75_001697600 [Trypanosoma vivax]